jgi:hypothetical protein
MGLPSARGNDENRGIGKGVAERNDGDALGPTGESQAPWALPQAA